MTLQALLDMRYNLQVDGIHRAGDVETCSVDVGVYAANLDNWPQPIFPEETGCSDLLFVPERFDVMGSYWNCNNQNTGREGMEG